MKKIVLVSVSSLILSGCVGTRVAPNAEQAPLVAANKVVTQPVVIPPPTPKMAYQLTYENNPSLDNAYKTYLKTGKAPNIETDGFIQFAYGTGSQPIISASPLELTVISLQPGESPTNVSSGDPLRWSYSIAFSGKEATKQAHIMVKPSMSDISTDLVITTDKRIYTIKMVSQHDGNYMRDVRFWYPDEIQDYWNGYNAKQVENMHKTDSIAQLPNINVNNLNFNYTVGKNSAFSAMPSWVPTRIFDDGTHTYIQFPASISSQDMPALFTQEGNSKNELVNYRVKYPYFVVDKVFSQAVLVMGVGKNQQKVIITNRQYH